MKIYIIPHPNNFNFYYHCPRGEEIVRRGLIENGIELVDSYSDCDFAILDYVPHDGEKKFVYDYIDQYAGKKLVCIDWMDEPDQYIYSPAKCAAYFKRSLFLPNVDPNSGQLCTHREELLTGAFGLYPTAYCALPEFSVGENIPHIDRPISVGCYLRPTCPNRWWVLEVMKNICQEAGFVHHVGEVNSASRSIGEKCHYDNEYLQYLVNSRIVVTAQPSGWEGDSRLWEALMNGSLVITDKIYTPYANKPENGKHLIEYQPGDIKSLVEPLEYYLNHPDEAQKIAEAGRKFTLENHLPRNRMKVVVDHLKGLLV